MPQITAINTSGDLAPLQCTNAGVLCAGITNWQPATAISLTGTNLSATIYGNGPSTIVMLSADSSGRLETVLRAASTELSALIYGWNDEDSKWMPFEVDDETGDLVTIDIGHHKIHEAKSFTIAATAGSLAVGNSLTVLLCTGGTSSVHLESRVYTTGALFYFMYEDVTLSAGPVARTLFNRNRQSANTSTAAASSLAGGPTGFSGGTQLVRLGLGTAKQASDNRSDEWILKKNSVYAFQAKSNATGIDCGIQLNFYELD